ncbi:MAG TPA: GAF domain-containing protein [Microbacterium sp.]|nr:GAF domain-containing protein [Microbacterium sp.]
MAAESDASANAERIVQLEQDLAEAKEQLTATNDVLGVIGRSDFRLEPVFETVVRHAARLCRADCGYVYQPDGDVFRIAFMLGGTPEYRAYMREHPVPQGPETLVGRVGLERRIVQIPDVLADPAYRWPVGRELGGYRTMLGAPMLAGDRVVGVLTLWRLEVDPFDDRTIALLNTLAAQAAVAIQNAELFQLGEISQAVSSTLDLDEVLTTIVARAAQLSGTEGGSIFEFDRATGLFALRTCVGTDPGLVAEIAATRIHIDETFIGRAARLASPLQSPDLALEPADPHLEKLSAAGWRSLLAIPLQWEQETIGALLVRRKVTGAFPSRTVDLLETLASQSAVAIHNARTFRALQQSSRRLEVASRHKSEFLASMSHELRTPLNAVIGFSDVLLERMFGELNERQDEYVRDIRDSGRHLLELINEILDLSKVEAGRMELDLADVAVEPLLEHALAMVRERASRQGVALELEVEAGLGVVVADELKLKQVVLNLLTNAVKFTNAGGSVALAARRAGDTLEVEVRDTGVGIAEADQARVFEAFQRGGRDARTSTEGTGLGLTLSRRFVELHGGRMWMESELGAGSRFGFAIPATAPAAAPDAAAAQRRTRAPAAVSASMVRGDTRTVVVIDDDPLELDLVEAVLVPEGYEVVRAADGAEGVQLVREHRPGVVLLDLLMPDMDGFAVVETLRGEPDTAAVPILVLTHKELTRADRYRLSGRINHLAQKGELDRAGLVALVGRLAVPAMEASR